MANTGLTRDESIALAKELLATGALTEVRAKSYDYVTPEKTVAQGYTVEAVIRDAKHGNTVVRTLRETVIAAHVVEDMQREIKARAKETRARIRAFRSNDR